MSSSSAELQTLPPLPNMHHSLYPPTLKEVNPHSTVSTYLRVDEKQTSQMTYPQYGYHIKDGYSTKDGNPANDGYPMKDGYATKEGYSTKEGYPVNETTLKIDTGAHNMNIPKELELKSKVRGSDKDSDDDSGFDVEHSPVLTTYSGKPLSPKTMVSPTEANKEIQKGDRQTDSRSSQEVSAIRKNGDELESTVSHKYRDAYHSSYSSRRSQDGVEMYPGYESTYKISSAFHYHKRSTPDHVGSPRSVDLDKHRYSSDGQRSVDLDKHRYSTDSQRSVDVEKHRYSSDSQRSVDLDKHRYSTDSQQQVCTLLLLDFL